MRVPFLAGLRERARQKRELEVEKDIVFSCMALGEVLEPLFLIYKVGPNNVTQAVIRSEQNHAAGVLWCSVSEDTVCLFWGPLGKL